MTYYDLNMNSKRITATDYITPSLASPVIDASYNFTTISIATDASGRNLLIPSPYNGQFCFLLGTNLLTCYNNGHGLK